MEDPTSVHSSWNAYFKQVQNNAPAGAAFQSPPDLASSAVYKVEGGIPSGVPAAAPAATGDVSKAIDRYLAVENLIRAYQVNFGNFENKKSSKFWKKKLKLKFKSKFWKKS